MSAQFTLKMDEFNAALRDYMLVCQRELSDILNRKLLFIVQRAWKLTPMANRQTIEGALSVVSYKISMSRKTGKFKRGQAMTAGMNASRIVNARRAAVGLPGLHGGELSRASRKLISRRLSAVGALRRGWSGAIRKLASAVHTSAESPPGPRVKQPGTSRPAKPGWNPIAEAEYDLTLGRTGLGNQPVGEIDPRVVNALQQSLDAETASMREYIALKMQKATNPFNAVKA